MLTLTIIVGNSTGRCYQRFIFLHSEHEWRHRPVLTAFSPSSLRSLLKIQAILITVYLNSLRSRVKTQTPITSCLYLNSLRSRVRKQAHVNTLAQICLTLLRSRMEACLYANAFLITVLRKDAIWLWMKSGVNEIVFSFTSRRSQCIQSPKQLMCKRLDHATQRTKLWFILTIMGMLAWPLTVQDRKGDQTINRAWNPLYDSPGEVRARKYSYEYRVGEIWFLHILGGQNSVENEINTESERRIAI